MIYNVMHFVKKKLFFLLFPEEYSVIRYVRRNKFTYCSHAKLKNISLAIHSIKKQNVPGIYIEAGVALGGSAILIAKIKCPLSPLYLYDVFGMIPPPSSHDGNDAHQRYDLIASGKSAGLGENKYYGYIKDLKKIVVGNIRQAGIDLDSGKIHFIEGLFQNSMNISDNVAFAHIDADWYESVKICIDRIAPHLNVGGIMIFDDYTSYSGCRKAVDEFLADNSLYFRMLLVDRSALITRIKDETAPEF